MEQLDSRRLTGANLIWDRPGAVLDAGLEDAEADRGIALWERQVRRMLAAVGWHHEQTRVRRFPYGASLAISAPIDALYAATEINEWAWEAASAMAAGGDEPPLEPDVQRLREAIAQESNLALITLAGAAAEHRATFLSDDDAVSLGLGTGSWTWPVAGLPGPAEVDWSAVHDVPVGLVTGTNGKTTSVRLCAAIARAAGLTTGLSSTDWIAVGDEIVDRGDYAGPGGARTVLRDARVELAILETARGGLLRRGLGVTHARGALITNVSEDHLGDFGSHSVDELLDVKWVVSHAVRESGRLVLNAEDERLVRKAAGYDGELAWFSLDPDNPILAGHVARGDHAATVRDGGVGLWSAGEWIPLLPVRDIPMALGGAARHNVANALGAAALSAALGVMPEAIAQGLGETDKDAHPGRCNLFELNGVTVLVDFAHNHEGMAALFHLANQLPAKRRLLCFGQAGDRPDDDIRDLAASAWRIGLQRVLIFELAKYARGRERGEVYGLLRGELLRQGADDAHIAHHETEVGALDDALAWAEPGDLVIMLSLGEQAAVLENLRTRSS